MEIKFYSIVSVCLISFLYLPSLSAFGAPQGGIFPSCSNSVDDFEARFNVNGFLPNSFVGWEIIAPDGTSPMHGYFSTNSTGGFQEDAEVETLMEGNHNLFVFDDLDHDYNVDKNGSMAKITIEVPCK